MKKLLYSGNYAYLTNLDSGIFIDIVMKRILQILFIIGISVSINAQQYKFPQPSAVWGIYIEDIVTKQRNNYAIYYYGDTLINTYSYAKYYANDTSNSGLTFFTRYDSGKVYLKQIGLAEVLQYNFALAKGDTFYSAIQKVDSVGVITLLNGQQRKYMHFINGSEWVEGIGDLKLGVVKGLECLDCSYHFVCHKDSSGLVYTNQDTLFDCDSMKVHQLPLLKVVQNVTNVSCYGGYDACIKVISSYGCQPYTYQWSTTSISSQICNIGSGKYWVTISDCNGVTIIDTAFVFQPPELVITTSTTPATNGISDGSATANVTGGTPGYSYNWMPAGNSVQTANGLACGSYEVTVTDANGCSATSVATVACVTDINELNADINFSIYPNPAKTRITIESTTNRPHSIELKNLLGETVYSAGVLTANKINIDIGTSPIGIYIVQVQNVPGNISGRHRLVVQR